MIFAPSRLCAKTLSLRAFVVKVNRQNAHTKIIFVTLIKTKFCYRP